MRGDVQKRLSHEPLDFYYPVVQWYTVRLMLILQCTLGLQSQIFYFINSFARAYIPSGEPVFVELPRYFSSDGGQCDVVLRLKKILYGQVENTRLWYEKFQFLLLCRGFLVSKLYPCMFMYKTVICVVYMDYCIFWALSQSEIDNVMNYFKEDGTSNN